MPNYTDNTFTVRAIPGARAAAAFMPKTSEVFKEEHEVAPVWINDKMQYVPWGADKISVRKSPNNKHTYYICSELGAKGTAEKHIILSH